MKQLRIKKDLTLKQLSDITELSTGFLSQFERGISTIAIDALAKIAKALDADMRDFFNPDNNPRTEPVMRSFELEYKQTGNQVLESILSRQVERFDILPRVCQIMPNASKNTSPAMVYSHDGEEMLYVLEGVLTVYVNGNEYTLYPGDSIQIHSVDDHNWENRTNRIVRFIQINYPNPYFQKNNETIADENK